MGEKTPGELIKHYFVQITEGCDRLECDEEMCKGCRNFYLKPEDNTKAAYIAVNLARDHYNHKHLCPGIMPCTFHPEIHATCQKFDSLMSCLVTGQPFLPEHKNILFQVLKSPDHFPFILASNQLQFSLLNMRLDDEKLYDTMKYVIINYEKFNEIKKDFPKTFSQILSQPCDTHFHIRALILYFVFIELFDPRDFQQHLFKLIDQIVKLDAKPYKLFWYTVKTLPRTMKQAVKSIQTHISLYAINEPESPKKRSLLFTVSRFFSLLYNNMNERSTLFSNENVTQRLRVENEYQTFTDNPIRSYLNTPIILTLQFKHSVLQYAQQTMQAKMVQRTRGFPQQANVVFNIITIDRSNLIQDSIEKLNNISSEDLVKKLKIKFLNEAGVDEGGLTREFFQLLTNELFSPKYGMFTLLQNKFYWFNAAFNDNPSPYQLLGTMVALCIYNGVVLPIRFPLLLYKKILNKQIELEDIEEVNPDFVRSVKQMEEMKSKGDDLKDLCLMFTGSVDNYGKYEEREIIEGGKDVQVDNENFEVYVKLYIEWFATTSVEAPFRAFKQGFMKISTSELFKRFTPDELDTLVSGEEVYDWDAFQKVAKYDGYTANSRPVKFFWTVFKEMNETTKRRFLLFTTGTDRAPVGGLKSVEIIIQKNGEVKNLPISHTCFNMFVMPPYTSIAETRRCVLKALEYAEGFGLV